MHTRTLKLAGLLLVIAVVAAACGSSSDSATPDASTTPPATGPTTSTGASALRTTLATALQEHEYLAGIAVYAAVNTGLESKVTKGAIDALDRNSQALADAIGSIYGDDAGKAFLPLWKKHIGFFVDYTVGGVTGDDAAQTKAKQDLDGYRADFGAFLAGANPNLTKDAVADALVPHVDTTFAAIDAVVAKKQNQFVMLRAGADELPAIAAVLADAIAAQFPSKF